jgi:hypothetical protein
MTPLRDGFAGFFAGTEAAFVGVADTGSVGGTGGGDLTTTFAATALNEVSPHSHCEYVVGMCDASKVRLTLESFSALRRLVPCVRVPPIPVAP